MGQKWFIGKDLLMDFGLKNNSIFKAQSSQLLLNH